MAQESRRADLEATLPDPKAVAIRNTVQARGQTVLSELESEGSQRRLPQLHDEGARDIPPGDRGIWRAHMYMGNSMSLRLRVTSIDGEGEHQDRRLVRLQ
jgi:hypothetical protein